MHMWPNSLSSITNKTYGNHTQQNKGDAPSTQKLTYTTALKMKNYLSFVLILLNTLKTIFNTRTRTFLTG